VFTGLVCLCGASLHQAQETAYMPALVRGPYLQMATAESMTIVWRTLGEIQPVVRYGEHPDQLNRQARSADILVRVSPDLAAAHPQHAVLSEAPDGTWQYEVTLRGLEPHKTYYYAICDGTRVLAGGDAAHSFRTYPRLGEAAPIRFSVQSDSHGRSWYVVRMQQVIHELCEREKRPLDFLLHCGDIASKGRDLEIHSTFAAQALNLPRRVLWIAPGNHDILGGRPLDQIPYTDAFVLPTRGECGGAPSNTEMYYSFDFGRLHVISLASFPEGLGRTAESPMAQWLKADLAKVRAEGKTDWIVAFFHSPVYESTWADTHLDSIEMREQIMPLLEAGGVDLVFGGHLHVYERSMLIDGIYSTPQTAANGVLDDGDGDPDGDAPYRKSVGLNPHEGTVAIITGHVNDPLMRSDGVHPVIRRAAVEVGMMVIDVEGDTLTGRMINIEGQVRDRFSIVKRGRVTPRRLARPRPGCAFYFRDRLEGPRFARIPLVTDPIVLDGKLDDEAWKKALVVPSGKVLYRQDGLYVASVYEGGKPESVNTPRDGNLLRESSSVDLLVDPRYDRRTHYYFGTNCEGVQVDARNGDLAYNPHWDVKTQKGILPGGRGWSVEMRIPWPALELTGPPDEETVMGMNLRLRWGTWSFSREWFRGRGDPRFLGVIEPSEFGVVKFGPGRVEWLIPAYDTWHYLAGAEPPANWASPEFDAADWKTGKAGFGYGDIDNATPLPDMRGRYTTVYARRDFSVADPVALTDLGLMIAYDDAFIAYLNGQEVLRVGVGSGRGMGARDIARHESDLPDFTLSAYIAHLRRHNGAVYHPLPGLPVSPEYFSLKKHLALLRLGRNVLAIEGHNASAESKAFTLDPQLIGTVRP